MMKCTYCTEQAEITLTLERTVCRFNRKEQNKKDLPVCRQHRKILRKISADAIWKNKLFDAQRLTDYLEYLQSAEETIEKKPKMAEKKQKTLEELK